MRGFCWTGGALERNREAGGMEAIRVKARVGPNREWEWVEEPPELPEGEVEVILLYEQGRDGSGTPPSEWPVLDGGKYEGSLRREDIYDENGR